MKTPHMYLITPDGDRYNNVKKIKENKLIVNATMDETDFKYTNRIGEVVGVPRRMGCLEKGDKVIVHHNTFRKWFNVHGLLKDSANFIKENTFSVGLDQIFAYDRGDGWIALADYCFVEAEEKEKDLNNLVMDLDRISTTRGKLFISNPILEKQGVEVGDTVLFNPTAAYRFDIDGKILYKMSAYRNISLVL